MNLNLRARAPALLLTTIAAALAAGCTSSVGGWGGGNGAAASAVQGRYPLAQKTLKRMESVDPTLAQFVRNAYGYAVFPSVGKGGFVVGGAYGEGGLFHAGALTANCRLYQGNIGFQLGGQEYSELVFFKGKAQYEEFRSGHFAFDAQASAVAVTAGAAANAAYSGGVAVFTLPKAGLMYEASIGGQKFSCTPAATK